MDMGAFLESILGTVLNYKRGPYVQCCGSLNTATVDKLVCYSKGPGTQSLGTWDFGTTS